MYSSPRFLDNQGRGLLDNGMGGGSAAFARAFFFGGGGGGAFFPAVGDAGGAESDGELEPKFLRMELATFIAACVAGADVSSCLDPVFIRPNLCCSSLSCAPLGGPGW